MDNTASCRAKTVVLVAAPCVVLLSALLSHVRASAAGNRPNVLYIMTDQQHAGTMSCTGSRYLQTPAMDSLAATGARFELAYAANPACLPSRVSTMTGHYPNRSGIRSNPDGRRPLPEAAPKESLGWVFRNAGYEPAYGGKTHWPRGMTPVSIGLRNLSDEEQASCPTAVYGMSLPWSRSANERISFPVLVSHSFTVSSNEPETIVVPSGEKSSDSTIQRWASIRPTSRPVLRFQARM
jgi:hypothetical protein